MTRVHEAAPHPELERWRENVGEPVALDLAPPLAEPVEQLHVVCWNLAIGAARLDELLARLRAEAGDVPLLILAQEAFRADASVPPRVAGRFHGGRIRPGTRTDIVEFAADHGLSLRYTPSMRNGADRSDRGNAILATVALRGAHTVCLPHVRQRRVAVGAELDEVPGVGFISAHLDTGGGLRNRERASLRFGSGRAAQAAGLARELLSRADGDVLLGADLNAPFGERDPAFRALVRAGFSPARRRGAWGHTFHRPLRLPLDHVLHRSSGGPIREVEVSRIDEHPMDRGARVYGSDHHPLFARVVLDVG